jgi:hypothetical protein
MVLVVVGVAELAFGALSRVLDLLQAPLTDVYCWLLDRGWVGE